MSTPPTPDEINMVAPIDFEVLDPEPWVRCRLTDGSIIKVRTIVITIKRLPRKNQDGTNVYAVQCNTSLRVTENVLKLNK